MWNYQILGAAEQIGFVHILWINKWALIQNDQSFYVRKAKTSSKV